MQLGIFAKTFTRPTFEESLDAVVEHGLKQVQFNLSTAGLPTLPETHESGPLHRDRRGPSRSAGLSSTRSRARST